MNKDRLNSDLGWWRKAGFFATLVLVMTFPAYLIRHALVSGKEKVEVNLPRYVGGKQCIDCHLKEYNDWTGSDHDRAMEVAGPASVEGDFNNTVFVSADGTETRFFMREGKYFVSTAGIKGRLTEFQVTYTFGVHPLQQYLIPFDSGRLQCLPIAWDTERQRWFSLVDSVYRDEEMTPDNWLYWTNNGQNWNGMCADCHSTHLEKGYDPETHTFHTSWSDIDVNCEACHGPGSEHLIWANLPEMDRPATDNGLVVQTSNISNFDLVTQCARCHARRSVMGDFESEPYAADPLNYMIPQLPVEPTYFADGQIREEDYVYASFTQSYMYLKDVSCKDCHQVHSLSLILPVEQNQLCLQCHRAQEYDTYTHTFHKKSNEEGQPLTLKKPWQGKTIVQVGEGALCINCHMPGSYYMAVDFRRDHSFRVPRPDLTVKYGTPNACNECHTDRSPQWAMENIEQWFGKNRKHHYSEVLLSATHREPEAEKKLRTLARDPLYPVIVRATAVSMLANYSDSVSQQMVAGALDDPESVIRLTAIEHLDVKSADQFIHELVPHLNDPVKALRTRAAFRLSPLTQQLIQSGYAVNFDTAIRQYVRSMMYMGDFATARQNLGVLDGNLGRVSEATRQYLEALRIDNRFYPAMINLAITYSQQGRNEDAEILLQKVIEIQPDLSEAYYYLGLLKAEENDYEESVGLLLKSAEINPGNNRIYYNLALLYQQLQLPEKAVIYFEKCLSQEPGNYDYLYAAALFYLKQGAKQKVRDLAGRINRLYPNNNVGEQLLEALKENNQNGT